MTSENGKEHAALLREGAFLGQYRINRCLGSDFIGTSYEAKSSRRHRSVVLRVLPETVMVSAETFAAFRRRLDDLSGLDHPCFVRMGPVEQDQGLLFVTEEKSDLDHTQDRSLADVVAGTCKRLTQAELASVARQAAGALKFAHGFRGHGVTDGDLRPEQLTLSAQGRLYIRGFGLLAAIAGRVSGPDSDLRALGLLLYRLITGLGGLDVQRRPSEFGVSTQWNRIIEKCLKSGREGGYSGTADLEADLETLSTKSGSGRCLTWVLAALVVVLLAVGTWWFVGKGKNRAAGSPAGKMPEPVAAETAQAIDELLKGAEDDLAHGRYDRAEESIKKILRSDANHAGARQLLADVQMQRGVGEAGPVKAEAEALWGKTRAVNQADGFGDRLAELETAMKQAQRLFSEMKFSEAAVAYRQVKEKAEALLALDAERAQAVRGRTECTRARDDAEYAGAEEKTADTWRQALGILEAADKAMTDAKFPDAVLLYAQAVKVFQDAVADAGGRERAEELRRRFVALRDNEESGVMERLTAPEREELTRLTEAANAAGEAKDWSKAADVWKAAHTSLTAALDRIAAGEKKESEATVRKTLPPRPASGNLVVNGDLELGSGNRAAGWSVLDGITGFWKRQGHPGSCIFFDTSVLQVDKKAFTEAEATFTGRKEGNQYATVGAHEGVWAFSSPVPVYPEDHYFIIEADVMGPAKSTPLFYPQVLIRGYQLFDPRRDAGTLSWFQVPHEPGPAYSEQFGSAQRRAQDGDYLMVFRHGLVCRNSAANIWEHYRMGFKLPDERRFRPEVLLLKTYAMWPLGEYRFDNVSLRPATEAEYLEARKNAHSIKGFMETE